MSYSEIEQSDEYSAYLNTLTAHKSLPKTPIDTDRLIIDSDEDEDGEYYRLEPTEREKKGGIYLIVKYHSGKKKDKISYYSIIDKDLSWLKNECDNHDLSSQGNKIDLINRLEEFYYNIFNDLFDYKIKTICKLDD
tara:strand:- start:126 stop:533 length:408 start_codon:yes stop_codon:yes gene_type:complete